MNFDVSFNTDHEKVLTIMIMKKCCEPRATRVTHQQEKVLPGWKKEGADRPITLERLQLVYCVSHEKRQNSNCKDVCVNPVTTIEGQLELKN